MQCLTTAKNINLNIRMPKVNKKYEFRGKPLKKLPNKDFNYENSSERNGIFLIENTDSFPFVNAKKGQEIIGYGKAPWPGLTDGFAAMFEKMTPEEDKYDFPEGTRIWHHFYLHYFNKE